MTIIERICSLLEQRGMKNKVVCEALGINSSTFSTWKAANVDNIPVRYLPILAELFGMTCDELITGETRIITEENEANLLATYRTLNWDGRQMVLAAAVAEKRKQEADARQQ